MSSSLNHHVLGHFENQSDVGSVTPAGSCEYDAELQTYTITSAGANIWGDHGDFHFVWKCMIGDFIVTARARVRCPQPELC